MNEFAFELRYDLWRLPTFEPNLAYPVHRWFHFKEGFSRDLVEFVVRRMGLQEGQVVLDPFVGSGTTPLTCMELGLDAAGVDASPLMVLISFAKTRLYDPERLLKIAGRLQSVAFRAQDLSSVSPLVRRAFTPETLQQLLSLRDEVMKIEDHDARAFFTLALMSAVMRCSYAIKDGSVIKIRKRKLPEFRGVFRSKVRQMIEDVKRIELRSGPAEIYAGDAREMNFIGDESIDAVITSPPYLNKIEYTRVYEIEMELFVGGSRPNLMRSYIGLSPRPGRIPPEAEGLPDSAVAYFVDLEQSLSEVLRVLRRGGRAAFVVSGGVYPGIVVEVDSVLARIAKRLGFEVERVIAMGKRVATYERVKRIGESRESVLMLRKG
ncbi:MAG: site-specific DNA-methyltransferase [Thaumarchaeota archaeon]|nr:site-specific DNA-methyltransferase [Candidatus Calditenuaceae archaeon]MDW8042485.1 DNA methyltransferase [Nitrososphaerota archaeon]